MRTSHAFLMLTLLLFGITSSLSAQQKPTVTGTIVDSKSAPVIAANIVEKGTKNRALSDVDGVFRISAAPGATLVISCIGFATREITVGTNTTLNITLQDDQRSLNEVVVTGFGESR